MPVTPVFEPKAEGKLLIIGGAESKKGNTPILDCFVSEIEKTAGAVEQKTAVIVPTALKRADEDVAEKYRKIFLKRGLTSVEIAPIHTRDAAMNADTAGKLQSATGIFLTGGDQVRITGILGGTSCGDAIFSSYVRGGIIAGTSAGASAMSETMVAGGDVDPVPSRGAIRMCPGLGLLSGAIIDQHFSERRRIGRLVTVVAQNPRVLGLGVDENTAALLRSDGILTVIGEQTVTVFDGTDVSHTNINDLYTGGPISVADLKLHILVSGDCFDIQKRILC